MTLIKLGTVGVLQDYRIINGRWGQDNQRFIFKCLKCGKFNKDIKTKGYFGCKHCGVK